MLFKNYLGLLPPESAKLALAESEPKPKVAASDFRADAGSHAFVCFAVDFELTVTDPPLVKTFGTENAGPVSFFNASYL